MALVLISSAAQMRAFGADLALNLRAGDLVITSGPLGAGKTTLTQGIGSAWGIEEITSPTFVIAREHAITNGPAARLLHVDAYRLRPEGGGTFDPRSALEDLDLNTDDAIIVMEWGEGLESSDYLEVRISITDDDQRDVEVIGHGPRWEAL